jgi:anti-anti-sigma factor
VRADTVGAVLDQESRIGPGKGTFGSLTVHVTRARPVEVRLAGELDLATRDVLALAIDVVSSRGDLCIDAAGISFVDCTGLASLVEAARTVRASGARFEVARMSPELARLARLTGTETAL